MSQTFIIDGSELSFDYETRADQWPEDVEWKLTVGGVDVIVEGLPVLTSGSASGNITKDVSAYVGQIGTLTFRIFSSSYCGNGDHTNTYLWVDNVNLSGLIKYSGDTVTLQATPKDGVAPYYVEFRKDNIIIDPSRLNNESNPIYNAPENVTITRMSPIADTYMSAGHRDSR